MKKSSFIKILMTVVLGLIVMPALAVEPATTHSVSGAVLSQGDPVGINGILQQAGKSQIVAAILAWFLGGWGVHLFYLGYKKKAMKRLFLSLGGLALYIAGYIFGAIAGAAIASGATSGGIFGILAGLFIFAGAVVIFVSWILGLIDFIKILTGDLKPANGDYSETL